LLRLRPEGELVTTCGGGREELDVELR